MNGDILVDYYHGQYRVTVDSYWQSGIYTQNILKLGLQNINRNYKSILLLGFGSGSMVKTIYNHFPYARIVGVDIDKQMVNIGKKYFTIDSYNNLHIIISDAHDYLKRRMKKFDLIIGDLFIGCDTESHLQSSEFIHKVRDHLKPQGIFLSNLSYLEKYRKKTDIYVSRIKRIFQKVDVLNHYPNLIVSAYSTYIFPIV